MIKDPIRTANVIVMAKLQAGENQDANPGAADAIAVEADSVRIQIGQRIIGSNETTGTLDDGEDQVAGAPSTVTFRLRLRGAGQAYAGAVRPPAHPILRSCAMKDRLVAAVAATALAAGTATTGTLGAAFAANAQEYRGVPLTITASATAARVGATPLIADYTAGRVATFADSFNPVLAATDSVSAPACVLYEPVTAQADILFVTIDINRDGKLYEFVDMKGSLKALGKSGDVIIAEATMTGVLRQKPVDAAAPAINPVTINAPLLMMESRLSDAFCIDRKQFPISTFELDLGLRMVSPDDPNSTNGFGGGVHTGRKMMLKCDPLSTLVANRDPYADVFAGTKVIGGIRVGSVANNRIAITMPALKLLGIEEAEREGLNVDQLNFQATGLNAGAMLCFW